MGKADLHIHTDAGDGLDSLHAIFEHVETQTDLDVIAITEHDSLEVAQEARELWLRGGHRFDFVPGVEVTTLEGHLIALYVENPIPSFMRVEKTIEAVWRQGGVCFVPHPMSWLTRSLGPRTLTRLMDAQLRPDAIELGSASPTTRLYIEKARRLNDEEYQMPSVGASDAHFVQAIGTGYTEFDGTSAFDLRKALGDGMVEGKQAPFPKMRDVGWKRALRVPIAGLGATPRRLGWRRTAWSFVRRYLP